jgi:hypothetical protein
MPIPGRWSDGPLGPFAGTVRHRRSFAIPQRLDDFERVWLTIAPINGAGTIALNEHDLGSWDAASRFETDITRLLRPRNELSVTVTANQDGGLTGEVALEIRHEAYLRDVRLTTHGRRIRIQGTLAGPPNRSYELYLIVDRRQAGYWQVETGEHDRLFDLTSELIEPANNSMDACLELVDKSIVCYTAEQRLPGIKNPNRDG